MRTVDLSTGFTAASAPTISGVLPTVTGSSASPTAITAGGGITPAGDVAELIFVSGPADITANPQIAAGTADGQTLQLIGTSDSSYVFLEDGTGLALNGDMLLNDNASITLVWDDSGSVWVEEGRK